LESLRQMVMAGTGIALVPELATLAPFGAEQLAVYRRFRPPEPRRELVLAWRRSFPRGDALQVLARGLRDAVARENAISRSLVSASPASAVASIGVGPIDMIDRCDRRLLFTHSDYTTCVPDLFLHREPPQAGTRRFTTVRAASSPSRTRTS
jgi:hypothetical protein